VVGKILEEDTYAYGYDAQTSAFGNLVSTGEFRHDLAFTGKSQHYAET
jgi:hypothetical protein